MAASNKLLLARLLNAEGKDLPISTQRVVDVARKKTLDELITDILGRIDGLSGGDIAKLKSDLSTLQTTLTTFLTGEDDDNGTLDRLKELVAAIAANKGSIDALVSDKATKAELNALITRVAALEGKNWTILDGIGKNETTGNLTFNGKELTGETGIAYGATAAEATSFTGKLKIVVEEVDWTQPEQGGNPDSGGETDNNG